MLGGDLSEDPCGVQDIDLVDILWRQDMDLGARREVFDQRLREKEAVLQRQRQWEEEEHQRLEQKKEEGRRRKLHLDEETGEVMPRPLPVPTEDDEDDEDHDSTLKDTMLEEEEETLSFAECMQLLADTFPLVENMQTSPSLVASPPVACLPPALPTPVASPVTQNPMLSALLAPQCVFPTLDTPTLNSLPPPAHSSPQLDLSTPPSPALPAFPVPLNLHPSQVVSSPAAPQALPGSVETDQAWLELLSFPEPYNVSMEVSEILEISLPLVVETQNYSSLPIEVEEEHYSQYLGFDSHGQLDYMSLPPRPMPSSNTVSQATLKAFYSSHSLLEDISSLPLEDLSPAPLEDLSPSPLEHLAPSPLENLSPVSLENLSPAPLENLSPAPLENLSPAPLENLSPPPLVNLSPATLENLSPPPLKNLPPIPLENLSPPALKDPTHPLLGDLSHPFLENLSSPPLEDLCPPFLEDLSPTPLEDLDLSLKEGFLTQPQGSTGKSPDSAVWMDTSPSNQDDGSWGFSESETEEMENSPSSNQSQHMEKTSHSKIHQSSSSSSLSSSGSSSLDVKPRPHGDLSEGFDHAESPFTKEKTRKSLKSRGRALMSRDEQRAKSLAIPFAVDSIINLPVDDFNELMTRHQFNESQLVLIRDIRRRGKNKVAAQNCRKRKMASISGLEQEMEELRRERRRLLGERAQRESSLKGLRGQLGSLYLEVFSKLRDEEGRPYSPSLYSLQQAADGSMFLVPRTNKTLKGNTN